MKRIFILVSMTSLFLVIGCENRVNRTFDCDKEAENVARLMNEYEFSEDKIFLDSAMVFVDNVIDKCPKWSMNMKLRKALIYNDLHEYEKALSIIYDFKDNDLPSIYSKSIIINKLLSIKALNDGDTVSYREYLKNVVNEYGDLITQNQHKIDSVLTLSNSQDIFMNGELIGCIEMYYHYKAILIGDQEIMSEIDRLQKRIGGNIVYFNELKSMILNKNKSSGRLFD